MAMIMHIMIEIASTAVIRSTRTIRIGRFRRRIF